MLVQNYDYLAAWSHHRKWWAIEDATGTDAALKVYHVACTRGSRLGHLTILLSCLPRSLPSSEIDLQGALFHHK